MKVKHLSMVVLGGIVAGVAYGQPSSASGLTMYGLVDAGIRYSDADINLDESKRKSALWRLADGGLGNSHWGLRGKEYLGGGMGAFFTLESDFSANNGQQSGRAGQIFDRQALVGLEMSGGTLSFGRQYGLAFESMKAFNPIGIGKLSATSWHTGLTGVHFDNSVRYQSSALAGVDVGLMYAFGGKAGDESRGRMVGASLGFKLEALTLSAGWQEARDDQRSASRAWSVGGTLATGPVRVFAGFVNGKLDQGFGTGADANNQPQFWGSTGIRVDSDQKGRHDQLIVAGVSHKPTSALNLTLGYMNDKIRGVTTPHRRQTAYGVADYSLSQRTGLYLAVDHNRNTEGVPLNPVEHEGTTKDRQTGVMMGLRHKF